MPDRLSLHAPLLVNMIGYCAGALAFGILFYLLLLDWRRATAERSLLPGIAAGLAFLWNVGSLIGMGTAPAGDPIADLILAGSLSVLSLLPAVLLHISLRSRPRFLWIGGYAVSGVAVALHVGDLVTGAPRFHYAAILLVTIGFAALTTASVVQEALTGAHDGGGKRLAGAMVLFLFAISFAHFGSAHDVKAWSGEALLHHAGIPLALFVLLQDYRFLLVDAFIRFLVNGLLAAVAVWASLAAEVRFGLIARASHDPFYAGLIFTAACRCSASSVRYSDTVWRVSPISWSMDTVRSELERTCGIRRQDKSRDRGDYALGARCHHSPRRSGAIPDDQTGGSDRLSAASLAEIDSRIANSKFRVEKCLRFPHVDRAATLLSSQREGYLRCGFRL